jgi:hypothetical protein
MNEYDDYEIWKNVTKSIKVYSNNKITPKVKEKTIFENRVKKKSNLIVKTSSFKINDKINHNTPSNTKLFELEDKKNGVLCHPVVSSSFTVGIALSKLICGVC